MIEFVPFPKVPRFSREVIITEKIDGTNASILIGEDGSFLTGSRTRWITPEDDNYGFSKWAHDHRDELVTLGPGQHFGEWWGQGIQRNYAQTRKRWSLFNVTRWADDAEPKRPECCDVVPVLYRGQMEEYGVLKGIKAALTKLEKEGSAAAPGFMNPEGIIIFHPASGMMFKKTLKNDEKPKGSLEAA